MLRLFVFDISESWPTYFRKGKCLAFDIRVVGTKTTTVIQHHSQTKLIDN